MAGLRVVLAALLALGGPGSVSAQSLTSLFIGQAGGVNLSGAGGQALHFAAPQAISVQTAGGTSVGLGGHYAMPLFAPAAVTTLGGSAASDSSITLTWSAPGEEGNRFALKNSKFSLQYSDSVEAAYAMDGTRTAAEVLVSTTNVAPGDSQSRDVTGLAQNTTYYVRIFTVNRSSQASQASNLAELATLASAPTAVAFFDVFETSASVTWASNPSASNFLVQASTASDFSGLLVSSAVSQASNSATLTSLFQATTYYARVASFNHAGLSNYSVAASTKTGGVRVAIWTGEAAAAASQTTGGAAVAGNWFDSLTPADGGDVILGSTGSTIGMAWDLPATTIRDLTVESSYLADASLAANLTMSGSLTLVGGTFKGQSFTHTVGGNWTRSGGSYDKGAGTVVFNGGAAQTIGGLASFHDFNAVTIAKTSGSTVTISGADLRAASLTVTSGGIELGAAATLSSHTITGPITVNGGSAVFHVGPSTVSVANGSAVLVSAGAIELHDAGLLRASSVTVAAAAAIRISENGAGPAGIAPADGATELAVSLAGSVDVASATFQGLGSKGLRLEATASLVRFSSVTLQGLTSNATALTLLPALASGATFFGLEFVESSVAANVYAPNLSGRATLRDSAGAGRGSSREVDDNNLLDWVPDDFPDATPPGAVPTILEASTGLEPGEIFLQWTSPGDDGVAGFLHGAYKVFYSTDSLDTPSAASAQVEIPVVKAVPLSFKSKMVAELLPGVTYYLTLFSVDEAGNASLPSNTATAQSKPAPLTAIHGKVTTLAGDPVQAVIVEALNASGLVVSTAFTDSSGVYKLDGLPQGTNVKVRASYTANGVTSSVSKDGIAVGSIDVDFTLEVSYTLAELAGRLQVARSAPGKLSVSASVGRPYVELFAGGRKVLIAPTESDGRFRIRNLLPGLYQVRAFNGLDWSRLQTVQLYEGENKTLELSYELLNAEKVFAFPNPAGSETTLRFESGVYPIEANVAVFDVAGQLVREIPGSEIASPQPGVYHAKWDLRNGRAESVASGVYLFMVKVKGPDGEVAKAVKKVAVVK